MSAVVLWRCAQCAAIDEEVAPEVSQVVATYIPQGWAVIDGVVHCPECSQPEEIENEEEGD